MEKNKGPCDHCGSSDACHDYGTHTFCFSCGKRVNKIDKVLKHFVALKTKPEGGSASGRGILPETYAKYGVWVEDNAYILPFTKKGRHQANLIRRTDSKVLFSEGEITGTELFGQSLFDPGSAQEITLTEGPFDAMAVHQMTGAKWPAVGVKSVVTAAKEVADNFEYLNSFKKIVVCFDKDEAKQKPDGSKFFPGQEAAQKVASMFPLKKVRVLTLKEHKDANDYLAAGKSVRFQKEWWDAPEWTPTGLKMAKDMWEEVSALKVYESVAYPWTGLEELTYGIRLSELVTVTADTGVGKTLFLKEIEHHILKNTNESGIGLLHLEEANADSIMGLMSIEASRPLHLPDVRAETSDSDLRDIFDRSVNTDRIVVWDHFGSNSVDEVLAKIHHMHNLGCKYIFVDHLSIIVSDQSGDERKQLDEISTKLKTLCMELNIAVVCVIHQNRQGQIRGTAGVEQLSNIVIKLLRDKEDDDDWRRNVTKVVIQKNRFSGLTGPACYLKYDNETGRLSELADVDIAKYEMGMKGDKPMKLEEW